MKCQDNHARVSEISQTSTIPASGDLVAIPSALAKIINLDRLIVPFEFLVESLVDFLRGRNLLTIDEFQDPENPEA